MKSSALNITVSCFANYRETKNPRPVNLLAWLTSDKYAQRIMQLRSEPDAKVFASIKASLPAVTISGEFTARNNEALVKHSGFVCIDVDPPKKPEDPICTNLDQMKSLMAQIPFVAYCGLSASGKGYFALVKVPDGIKDNNEHKAYYKALEMDFAAAGLIVDATNDVSRLRGYSYDPAAYFNHQPDTYTKQVHHIDVKPGQYGKWTPPEPRTHTSVPIFEPITMLDDMTSPIDHFLQEADVLSMMQEHGYTEAFRSKSKVYIKRPGSTSDYSGNLAGGTLVMHSTQTIFEPGRGYNAFRVYATLYHHGDTSEAFRCIEGAGFGGELWKAARTQKQRFVPTPPPHKAPHGLNPYTGEVFDQRGYPADWDTVEPPERGTPEYNEITLLVMREMDAEIIPDADPSKIDQFWQEVSHKQKDWRVRVHDDD
jgi:hypothetical protein